MKFIELLLPGTRPMLLRVDAIDSVVFRGDTVLAITIASWPNPLVYEGVDAEVHYQKLKVALEVATL